MAFPKQPAKLQKSAKNNCSLEINVLQHFGPKYKTNYLRPYFSTCAVNLLRPVSLIELTALFGLLIAAVFVRLYKLESLRSIIPMESHYIRSINNYFTNEFFLDLYPPLAKIFSAAVALLCGYDGTSTAYEAAKPQEQPMAFVVLRFISALQGATCVVLTYFILKISGCRAFVLLAGALVMLFDSGNTVISRFIGCDPYFLSTLAFVTLLQLKLGQLSVLGKQWFKLLYFLGLSLGVLVSLKYTGLFTVGWILVLHLKKAWLIAGDLDLAAQKRGRYISKYIGCTVVFVVLVPVMVFSSVNIVSLRLVSKINSLESDQGFSLMSPRFQAGLLGNDLVSGNTSVVPLNVLYGSKVTIRHLDSLGGYLHSHNLTYQAGSHEQQITLYNYKDPNNEWIIEHKVRKTDEELFGKRFYVSEGSYIRLRHAVTGRYLHVNDLRGPVSEQEYDYEVSGKGGEDLYWGDQADNWQILAVLKYSKDRIANDPGDSIIHPIGTVFRLYNRAMKCELLSHDITLPEWGGNQQEVICVKDASKIRSNFYIESNSHPLLDSNPNQDKIQLLPLSMTAKVTEYLLSVAKLNRQYDIHLGEDADATYPDRWLTGSSKMLLYQDVAAREIALPGKAIPTVIFEINQTTQYVGLGLIAFFIVYHCVFVFKHLKWFGQLLLTNKPLGRVSSPETQEKTKHRLMWAKYNSIVFDLFLGWISHLAPFFFLDRPYKATNYLPAYFFLILIIGQAFELAVSRGILGYAFVGAVVSSIISSFMESRNTIYGVVL